MDYFKEQADEAEKNLTDDFMPEWASKENSSHEAYQATERLKGERMQFIKDHSRPSHYKTKKTYQITGREVARAVDIAITTLLQTSTYSDGFSDYLKEVNLELEDLKDKRIAKAKKSRSRGPIAENKTELVNDVRTLKAELKELKTKNAKDQAEHAINMLHPKVAELLLIKQKISKGSVIPFKNK